MPATAEVYTQASGTFRTSIDYDLSETLIDIADAAANDGIFNRVNFDLLRVNSTDGANGQTANGPLTPEGLPIFGTPAEVIEGGDLFGIRHALNGNVGSGPWRVYRRASDDAFVLATLTGETKAAADLQPDEFYLDDNWAETTDIAEAMGITPVQCLDPFVPASDMINCRDIAAADCGQNGRPDFWDGSMCVADCGAGFTNPAVGETCRAEVQPQTSGGESDGKKHTGALIFGGLMIMGAIGYAIDGDVSPFNFSPDFGYSATESGYAANAGGRIDFRKDNWHLWQNATQTNTDGKFADFRYTSGAKYKTDIWAATFSESVNGETADYNFALSANLRGGIWKISPVYRMHSEYEKGETETQNTLNLEGILRINRWTISPSAGFRWENADDFTDNARFRIDAVHRF